MHAEIMNYRGWGKCYRLANSLVDLVVTAEVGPRIIRYGFLGHENEFKEIEEDMGKKGGDEWRMYGGHRLWHAPEAVPRTYVPDNSPVNVLEENGGLRIIQPIELTTGIQKEIEIYLDEYKSHARIVHRLRNAGLWQVELAVWCISMLEAGGTAIMPLPLRRPYPEDLLPNSSLVLWAYTDLTDSRYKFGKQYLLIRQEPDHRNPLKLGANVPDGWVAYARGGHLFVKRFQYKPDAVYPDRGCCFESWMNDEFLELETLSPLALLNPGQEIEYSEEWYLFEGVRTPTSEPEVIESVLPAVNRTSEPISKMDD